MLILAVVAAVKKSCMLDEGEDGTCLAWQKVSAKHRTSKRPSETAPNLARKIIAIDERACDCDYDSLPLECDHSVNMSEEIETSKPPPIVLSVVSDIVGILQYLKLKIDSKEFSYKSQRDGHVQIMVKTIAIYRN